MNDSDAVSHVLFVTGEYPPLTGGVGAYTEKLANALVDRGRKASVLTTTNAEALGTDPPIDVYPSIGRWDWRIWRSVPELARQIHAQWVHVQYQTAAFNMNPSINFAVNRWRRHGLCVAWTYHDVLNPYLFPKAGKRLRDYVTRYPASRADLTIATNEGDRLALAPTAKHLAHIPIGSNIQSAEVTPAQRDEIRKHFGYRSDDFVIAYFGFLNRSKGGLTLIRTLERVRRELPRAQLLMIGERVGASDPTNYAYLQEVESLIDTLDLRSSVRWTGRLEDAKVSGALSAADVLFMPYEDGASLRRGTLMAGIAHGCAIVTTTPQAPTPELVDGRDLLYVPSGDAAASAEEMLRLARDRALLARLQSGARSASSQFTWQEIARQHGVLYDSLPG